MSLVELVSKTPGVSTTRISFPNRCACLLVHCEVTDEPEVVDSKKPPFKMVFPVALFPLPVFPSSTIRTSLSSPPPKLGPSSGEPCPWL